MHLHSMCACVPYFKYDHFKIHFIPTSASLILSLSIHKMHYSLNATVPVTNAIQDTKTFPKCYVGRNGK